MAEVTAAEPDRVKLLDAAALTTMMPAKGTEFETVTGKGPVVRLALTQSDSDRRRRGDGR
jgi:hypothetical protein